MLSILYLRSDRPSAEPDPEFDRELDRDPELKAFLTDGGILSSSKVGICSQSPK